MTRTLNRPLTLPTGWTPAEWEALIDALTRRKLISAGLALGLISVLPGCGGGSGGSQANPSPSSGWTFTDDRGVTITRPKRPERIVAYVPIAASLWDCGVRPVGVYGTTLRPDGTPEITVGEMDLDAVASLGETYGELDLEKLASLQPDLIVFDMYTQEVDLWGLSPDALAQVEQIAPIAGISFSGHPATTVIGRLEDLAAAVGADLTASGVTSAREQFSQASEEFKAAVAEKPGLTVLFMAGWPDNLYIANPAGWPDLQYLQELGLNIVTPETPDPEYPIWQTLSWEQAIKYPADLALQDDRSGAPSVEELKNFPTWAAHPAAKAGQVGAWQTEFVPSYRGFTLVLEALTEIIRKSRDDVV